MQSSRLKVLVCDTFAGPEYLSDEYRATFPQAEFFHHIAPGCPASKPHPHGAQVASVVLLPVFNVPVECHFLRFLDSRDAGCDQYMLDVIRDVKPDVVQNSWGQNVDPMRVIDNVISSTWLPWVDREKALRDSLDYVMVASSGNEDTRGRRFEDHCHPWKDMEGVVSIGSVDRRGVETEWSSDGSKLAGVAGGERRWLLLPNPAKWELGNGTSFSSPVVSGLYLYLLSAGEIVRGNAAFREWWKQRRMVLPGVALPDPKVGEINFEPHYQQACWKTGAWGACRVPSHEQLSQQVRWLDFKEVPVA